MFGTFGDYAYPPIAEVWDHLSDLELGPMSRLSALHARAGAEPRQASVVYGFALASAGSFIFDLSVWIRLAHRSGIWWLISTQSVSVIGLGLVGLLLARRVVTDSQKLAAIILVGIALLLVPMPTELMVGDITLEQATTEILVFLVIASAVMPSKWGLAILSTIVTGLWLWIEFANGATGASISSWSLVWAVGLIGSLSVFVMVEAHRSIANQIQRASIALAWQDSLTGLANRAGCTEHGVRPIALAQRRGQTCWAAFVDVDGFKAINDQLGHHAGDEVLRAVGMAIETSQRTADLTARWGGDEFVVIGVGVPPEAAAFEERVVASLVGLSQSVRAVWEPSVTAGIAVVDPLPHRAPSAILMELVERADEAMYDRRRLVEREPR
ncbi:MAG: GGDEF domain-containing protein [Actinomycetes bacterium]